MFRLILQAAVSFSLIFAVTFVTKADEQVLTVAIKQAPPFAIQGNDGKWRGISVELWESIADDLNLKFEYQQSPDVVTLMDQLKKKQVDLAIGAITVTAEREKFSDFSHPFFTTGLGIATNTESTNILSFVKGLFNWQLLQAVSGLLVLLLIIGTIIWVLEHKKNHQQFGGNPVQGISNGFWWSAVTMTTVGYGDKAPVTFTGRAFATVWMFASIIAISGFTAAIASAITVQQLSGAVSGPDDLPDAKVAIVDGSSSIAYLRDKGIYFQGYPSIEEALTVLNEGSVDAVVHDAPLLQFLVKKNQFNNVKVLGETLQRQDYAIALKSASTLRESVNRSLLEKIYSPKWPDILFKYLGHQSI